MIRRILILLLPMLVAGCITDPGGDGGDGGTGQPVPGSGFFSARVVNQSSQDADVTLMFYMRDTLVHDTRLSRVRPDTNIPIAGPEQAQRLVVDGTRKDGSPLDAIEYVFGEDVLEGGEVIYVITDLDVNTGGVGNPLPDTDPPPPPPPDGPPDVEPPTGGGGGGGGPVVVSPDCNGNGVIDSQDIETGAPDCNENGVPDECDLAAETSSDINENGIPDLCDPDCNQNGVPDDIDVQSEKGLDCNRNLVPDECDIAAGTSVDRNENRLPDECEIDCNQNHLPDDYDILAELSFDCNQNQVPDECDVAGCTSMDCNENAVPDDCDIAAGTAFDKDGNGVPDECRQPKGDCDFNFQITVEDWKVIQGECFQGPSGAINPQRGLFCSCFDFDFDEDLDLRDFAEFQRSLSSCPPRPGTDEPQP